MKPTMHLQIPPDTASLQTQLAACLEQRDALSEPLSVLDRAQLSEGTYPKEVITCRLGPGVIRRYFCKYAAGEVHNSFGHRGGLPLEIDIYTQILPHLPVTVPTLVGGDWNRETGMAWLILEYLEQSVRIAKSPDPAALRKASAWIGHFHRLNEAFPTTDSVATLKAYDPAYYIGWAERTWHFARLTQQDTPWLNHLCTRFEEIVTTFLMHPSTLIHGEYYSKNILYESEVVYPVDWESAALAAGEIDLATLTDGWGEQASDACKRTYVDARWPGGAPDRFEDRLRAARLYVNFRWLSDLRERAIKKPGTWYFWRLENLKRIGEEMDVL